MERPTTIPPLAILAQATLPTRYGEIRTLAFTVEGDAREHLALIHGQPSGKERVVVRVHSECITGEVFGSLRCDCGAQLDSAMREVVRRGTGIILYLRQDRKSTRLNSSHVKISYAVFCLKKKK